MHLTNTCLFTKFSVQIHSNAQTTWVCRGSWQYNKGSSLCVLQTRVLYSAEDLSQGFFHIFVPEGIDDGIQHWGDDSIEHRYHFFQFRSLTGMWTEVHEDDSAVEDGDHREMAGTCGKGLVPSRSRWEIQDGRNNQGIRSQSQEKGHKHNHCRDKKDHCVCHEGVSSR